MFWQWLQSRKARRALAMNDKVRAQLAADAESAREFALRNHPFGLRLLELDRAAAIAGGDWDAALKADQMLNHISNSFVYARTDPGERGNQ